MIEKFTAITSPNGLMADKLNEVIDAVNELYSRATVKSRDTIEEWKRIAGTNYAVSSHGRIKNIKHNRILFGYISFRGYPQVELMIKGKRAHFSVHRLVAKAFIPNPHNKSYVNHKNGNTCDNHIDNLEWVSPYENTQHAIKQLGVQPSRRLSSLLNTLIKENNDLKNELKKYKNGYNNEQRI